jgi:hypothetical protein
MEPTDKDILRLLEVQKKMKPYITVEQARKILNLSSKSVAHAVLNEMVRRGLARGFIAGHVYHYHIEEVKK